jgi:hypothetical protein
MPAIAPTSKLAARYHPSWYTSRVSAVRIGLSSFLRPELRGVVRQPGRVHSARSTRLRRETIVKSIARVFSQRRRNDWTLALGAAIALAALLAGVRHRSRAAGPDRTLADTPPRKPFLVAVPEQRAQEPGENLAGEPVGPTTNGARDASGGAV